ncbi:MAG: HEPN domain-containing protein [Phycisphaerae bacterium]
MPENENVFLIIREWVDKAENDLKNAAHTLKLGRDCPADTVCFHTQQCVEKYMKALLVWYGVDFSRTHDIGILEKLLAGHYQSGLSIEGQRRLTGYATTMRYPGMYETIRLTEARQAVRIARRIRNEIRKLLPNGVFDQRRK